MACAFAHFKTVNYSCLKSAEVSSLFGLISASPIHMCNRTIKTKELPLSVRYV